MFKRRNQIISLILGIIMFLPITGMVSSCKKKEKVKLIGIEGSSISSTDSQKSLMDTPLYAFQLANTDMPAVLDTETNTQETETGTGYIDGVVPQGLILFDDCEVGEITIKLDNPNQYYIHDLRIKCDLSTARIKVDNVWIPMDGETKIRWSGATNNSATYQIYLPKGVATDRTGWITILDLRYSDDKIKVDISEKNAAFITQMKRPMTVDLISNGSDAIKFKINTDERCTITQIDGDLKKNEETGLYEITDSYGNFTISYTYTINDTNISSKYSTDELQKMQCIERFGCGMYFVNVYVNGPFYYAYHNNINKALYGLRLDGYGFNWKSFSDIKDKDVRDKFSTLISYQYCLFNTDDDDPLNTNFYISINNGEFVPAYYISCNDPTDISSCLLLFYSKDQLYGRFPTVINFKIKVNDQIIFNSSDLYDFIE